MSKDEQIKQIIHKISDRPHTDIGSHVTLHNLDMDSLDKLALADEIMEQMGVQIPDEKIGEWNTVGDVIDSVA